MVIKLVKSLFGKRKHKELKLVTLDELREFINKEEEALRKEREEARRVAISKILDVIDSLGGNIKDLAELDVDGINAPDNVKIVMRSSIESFIRRAEDFSVKLRELCSSNGEGFYPNFRSVYVNFQKITSRSLSVIGEFFNPQLKVIGEKFQMIEKAVEESEKAGRSKHSMMVERVAALLERIDEVGERKRKKEKHISAMKREIKRIAKEKEKLVGEKNALEKSPAFIKIKELKAGLESLMAEEEGVKGEIKHFFFPLNKALSRYVYIAGPRNVLAYYLNDPVSAFEKDHSLEVKKELSSLKKMVIGGQIKLKDQQKGRILLAIDKASSSELFRKWRSRMSMLKREIKEVSSELRSLEKGCRANKLEIDISSLTSHINQLENKLEKLSSKSDDDTSELIDELYFPLKSLGFRLSYP